MSFSETVHCNSLLLCMVMGAALVTSGLPAFSQAHARFVLVGDDGSVPAIVHGPGESVQAQVLRDALHESLGVEPEVFLDEEVMEPGTWRLAEPWLHRSLIALGNVDTNIDRSSPQRGC